MLCVAWGSCADEDFGVQACDQWYSGWQHFQDCSTEAGSWCCSAWRRGFLIWAQWWGCTHYGGDTICTPGCATTILRLKIEEGSTLHWFKTISGEALLVQIDHLKIWLCNYNMFSADHDAHWFFFHLLQAYSYSKPRSKLTSLRIFPQLYHYIQLDFVIVQICSLLQTEVGNLTSWIIYILPQDNVLGRHPHTYYSHLPSRCICLGSSPVCRRSPVRGEPTGLLIPILVLARKLFYNCLPSWSSFLVLVHRHRVEDLRRFVMVPLNGLYQSQIYFMSRSCCATGVLI